MAKSIETQIRAGNLRALELAEKGQTLFEQAYAETGTAPGVEADKALQRKLEHMKNNSALMLKNMREAYEGDAG